MRAFLAHSDRDNVGVAIVEIKRGQTLRGAALDHTASTLQLTAVEGIPVGHKIALKDLKAGDTVMKYGEDIGKVVGRYSAWRTRSRSQSKNEEVVEHARSGI